MDEVAERVDALGAPLLAGRPDELLSPVDVVDAAPLEGARRARSLAAIVFFKSW